MLLCTKLDSECDRQATVVGRLLTTLGDDRRAVEKLFLVRRLWRKAPEEITTTITTHPSMASAIGMALCYSNTTVYYGIHKRSECIPVSLDCGVTNLIHDRRSCVDFTLEVEANVARCVHSSVNKPGVKCNSWL